MISINKPRIKEIQISKKTTSIVLLLFISILFSSSVLAVDPLNQLHLNLQITDDAGTITPGTYDFVFNISSTEGCTVISYSDSASLTTDNRGIISYYLEDVDVDFTQQHWLCYYRDGVLKSNSAIAKTPYSYSTDNVSAGGIRDDANLILNTHNITAMFGFFNLSWDYLYNLPSNLDLDVTNDLTTSTIWGGDFDGTGAYPTLRTDSVSVNELDDISAPNDGQLLSYDSASGRLLWVDADGNSLVNNGGTISGNVIITGNLSVYGTFTNGTVVEQTINGSFYPSLNVTYDLGNESYQWNTLYVQNIPGFLKLSDYPNLDTDSTDDVTTATSLGGDVSGTYDNVSLDANVIVPTHLNSSNSPTDGLVLAYNETSDTFYWRTAGTGTGTGTIDGNGTEGYVPIWNSSTTLGNSNIYENATGIYIG